LPLLADASEGFSISSQVSENPFFPCLQSLSNFRPPSLETAPAMAAFIRPQAPKALPRSVAVRAFSGEAKRKRPPTVLSIQSHVVSGAAGNSAAVFPMRRLGINVWPLNTVQFSNHTQYGKWTGHVFPPEHITQIVDGIEAIGALGKIDAVLSGYLGSEAQGGAVLEVVRRVKEANPEAIYCCDPVMGHPEKGCIVAPGVAEFFHSEVVSKADIMCPNVLELSMLVSGRQEIDLDNVYEVAEAADDLRAKGPKAVFIKHLGKLGFHSGERFEMMLSCNEGNWVVDTPLLPFDRPPVGVGDLTTGSFLARVVKGYTYRQAFELTTAGYMCVMEATHELGEYELQLVAAQDEFASPNLRGLGVELKRLMPLDPEERRLMLRRKNFSRQFPN